MANKCEYHMPEHNCDDFTDNYNTEIIEALYWRRDGKYGYGEGYKTIEQKLETQKENKAVNRSIKECPECCGPIIHEGGCMTCYQCGWSSCG
jgi:hypothetical protein